MGNRIVRAARRAVMCAVLGAAAVGYAQEAGNAAGAGGSGRGNGEAGGGAAGMLRGRLPFTLSVGLTGITGPLDAEGAPDYLAAVNARYGQGTKPEDNLFVGWAELTGAKDHFLKDDVREATLKMAGAKVVDAAVVWQDYMEYARGKVEDEAIRAEFDRRGLLHQNLWHAEDCALMAGYLKEMEKPLDAMVALAGRPRWWGPQVSTDGRSVLHADAPEVGQILQAAQVLGARATQRAGAEDFDGFLRDAIAVRRLARLLGQGPTLLERGTAMEVERVGLETMGAVVGSGKLTAEQRGTLRAALMKLPKLGNIEEAVDVVDRWQEFDDAIIVATGKMGVLQLDDPPAIDPEEVDWAAVLKDVGAGMDKRLAALRVATMRELVPPVETTLDLAQINGPMQFMQGRPAAVSLQKNNGESTAAHAQRIAEWVLRLPDEGPGLMQEEDQRIAQMGLAMLEALLAAADYREKTGKWPEVLGDLVPAYMAAVPRDIYSEFGRYDVAFDVLVDGVRISSMGRPGKPGLMLGARE